jgi:hypothetical protein
MVERFLQQDGIHQGLAFVVIQIQAADVFALDREGHGPVIILPDPEPGQSAALAKEKGAPEDIRGFNHAPHLLITSFLFLDPGVDLNEAGLGHGVRLR